MRMPSEHQPASATSNNPRMPFATCTPRILRHTSFPSQSKHRTIAHAHSDKHDELRDASTHHKMVLMAMRDGQMMLSVRDRARGD